MFPCELVYYGWMSHLIEPVVWDAYPAYPDSSGHVYRW
jgi:hypothetical protein